MHLTVPPRYLAPAAIVFYRALRRSVTRVVDDPHDVLRSAGEGSPFLFVCRHGQLLPLLFEMERLSLTILVSRSSDGELLAQTLRSRGFELARGSGSQQALSAGRAALRVLRAGRSLGLASDGPRGPLGSVHAGVIELARRSGTPIVTLRVEGGWRPTAPGSWDRFELPLPGSRLRIVVGEPLDVARSSRAADELRRVVAQRLAGRPAAAGERVVPAAPGLGHL